MLGVVSPLARGSGGILLLAAGAKAIEPLPIANWVAAAAGMSNRTAVVTAWFLVCVEAGLGLGLMVAPRRFAAAGVVVFVIFAAVHAASLIWQESGRCPCFGAVLGGVPEWLFDAALGVGSAVAATACVGLWRSRLTAEGACDEKVVEVQP